MVVLRYEIRKVALMKSRIRCWALIVLLFCSGLFASAAKHVLYQVSTINALMQGIYDGPTTLATLLTQGNFGLGTSTQLDGEMVVLDGTCYQIRSDGQVSVMPKTATTPFAAVTTFTADSTFIMTAPLTLDALKKTIDEKLVNKNIFYAVKITGAFSLIRARSVPKQHQPYPLLTTVVKTQPVFEMHDVQGTIVAFCCPAFVAGINVIGYHLHFLGAGCKTGGHVMDCTLSSGTIQIAELPTFTLALPNDAAFAAADLTTSNPAAVQKVEK